VFPGSALPAVVIDTLAGPSTLTRSPGKKEGKNPPRILAPTPCNPNRHCTSAVCILSLSWQQLALPNGAWWHLAGHGPFFIWPFFPCFCPRDHENPQKHLSLLSPDSSVRLWQGPGVEATFRTLSLFSPPSEWQLPASCPRGFTKFHY
jgi:hypothetical protein